MNKDQIAAPGDPQRGSRVGMEEGCPACEVVPDQRGQTTMRRVTRQPRVSIVIPCRNEEAFIGACIASLVNGSFPRERLEVIVVDGMSDDRSRSVISEAAGREGVVKLLDNPARTTPVALNIGIRHATGDVVAILGAHSVYPSAYIATLVEWLFESGADTVGGVCRTLPANATPKARAIAAGLSHPFGVGNSYFRIGAREPRWVDTVAFGCYRRDVFDRIGLFDEELVRNQDDELNGRLVQQGGRILLVPGVESEYYARDLLGKLWRMYYQYGYFKPLAARKIGSVLTARQLVPAVFVAAVLAGTVLTWPIGFLRAPFAAMLAAYAAVDVGCAAHASRRNGVRCALWLTVVFPVLHFAYGLGYLKGLADFVFRNRRPDARVRAITPTR